MTDLIHKQTTGEVKVLDPEQRTLSMVVSTEAKDRDGDIIEAKGWELDNYRNNPVVLFAHKYNEPAVAKALTIEDLNTIKHQAFAELCRAYLMHRRAMDLIRTSGFRAGSYQVSAAVGERMAKEAEMALTRARHRINNSYVAERTGAGKAVASE